MRIAIRHWPLAAASAVLLGLAGCTGLSDSGKPAAPATPPPLFDRMGGRPVLTAVVEDFPQIVAGDPRINRRFVVGDMARFKAAMVEQLCAATGGPCHPPAGALHDTHAAMGVSDAEFNATVQDLRRAMTRHDVPIELQVEFAAAMEPLRDQVVSPMRPTQSVVTQVIAQKKGGKVVVASASSPKKPTAATGKTAPAKKSSAAKKPVPEQTPTTNKALPPQSRYRVWTRP